MNQKKIDNNKRKEQLRSAQQRRRRKLKELNCKSIDVHLEKQVFNALSVLCEMHKMTKTEAINCLVNYAVTDGNTLSNTIFSQKRIDRISNNNKTKTAKTNKSPYINTLE